MLPSYGDLASNGELESRVRAAHALQSPCRLCPRTCGVKRAEGERGACNAAVAAKVFRCAPHFGEEPPLTGTSGSGTLFLSGCPLHCVYCQNYRFSQRGEGREVRSAELARMFLDLKEQGCHNLNLVTATHFLPQLLSALEIAAGAGFDLPIVYNSSGYESLETLGILDGIVDIYLSDMRYDNADTAAAWSGVRDYPAVNRAAIREMWRQVGPLVTDGAGVARKGLVVRHLVLPGGLSGTEGILRFLAEEISREVAVSLMGQYTPCHRAVGHSLLGRRVSRDEFAGAVSCLGEFGLESGWVQEVSSDGDDECLRGESLEQNV